MDFINSERSVMEEQCFIDEEVHSDLIDIKPIERLTKEEWLKMKQDLLKLDAEKSHSVT